MANIVVKLPWGDPLNPPLITLVDQSDGTFAPRISGVSISSGGGTAKIGGNGSTNGKKPGQFIVQDATTAADGKVQVQTAGTFGVNTQILQTDGTNATWSGSIYSEAASAPVLFATPIYGDTTAVTGGLYVWTGSAYRKVSGALP